MNECNVTLKNIKRICGKKNIGGIKTLYLIDRASLMDKKYFVYTKSTDNEVAVKFGTAAASKKLEGAEGMGFAKVDLIPETSNYTTTINRSAENNTVFYATELNIQLNSLDKDQYIEIEKITRGQFVAILELASGQGVFIGNDFALVAGGTITSGTVVEDGITNAIKLTVNSNELPRLIDLAGRI